MTVAANLQEAIDDIALDIGTASGTVPVPDQVPARMRNWLDQMFLATSLFPGPGTPWERSSVLQRSVFDWSVPTIQANAQIQAIGNGMQAGNLAINVVLRTLLAVQAAQTAGRITAAQRDSVVVIYTSCWE
jgi:hypothetical protein